MKGWHYSFQNSIDIINDTISNLTFNDIDGILTIQKGGTGTSDKSLVLSNIGFATNEDFPTNISVPNDYSTIQEAISAIPKYLTKTVYIDISAGTYTEDLSVIGFTGPGSLYIRGQTKEIVIIYGTHRFYNNTASIYLQSRTAPAADADTSTTPYLRIMGPALSSGQASLLTIDNCSYVSITNTGFWGVARTTENVYYTGINARYGSNVYVSKCFFRRLYYCTRAQNGSTLSMSYCAGGVTAGTAVNTTNHQNNYVMKVDRSSGYVYQTVPGAASETIPYKSYGSYGGTASVTTATAFTVA